MLSIHIQISREHLRCKTTRTTRSPVGSQSAVPLPASHHSFDARRYGFSSHLSNDGEQKAELCRRGIQAVRESNKIKNPQGAHTMWHQISRVPAFRQVNSAGRLYKACKALGIRSQGDRWHAAGPSRCLPSVFFLTVKAARLSLTGEKNRKRWTQQADCLFEMIMAGIHTETNSAKEPATLTQEEKGSSS